MASGVAELCPRCGERRVGPFCERCGYFFPPTSADAGPVAPSVWCAIVTPDRGYFDAGGADADRFTFPAGSTARHVALTGASVRIGRRSDSRKTTPEIDLTDPPSDPGVSREHARLLAQPDGGWALVDDGSTNGTYLNGSTKRIPRHQQITLTDGDRVHLGVWTTITLRRAPNL